MCAYRAASTTIISLRALKLTVRIDSLYDNRSSAIYAVLEVRHACPTTQHQEHVENNLIGTPTQIGRHDTIDPTGFRVFRFLCKQYALRRARHS